MKKASLNYTTKYVKFVKIFRAFHIFSKKNKILLKLCFLLLKSNTFLRQTTSNLKLILKLFPKIIFSCTSFRNKAKTKFTKM